MDGTSESHSCSQLSSMIEDKLGLIAKLKNDFEHKKVTSGNSVDDQIALAELEFRLAQEEMTLLSLQEKHWEAAALWDVPRTPDIQKEVCEVLHSYILSLKEKGSIPALHASEHLALENSVLISSQSDRPSIPKVEWAHHSTDLQIGDRLLEVNGHLVVGKSSSEVSKILNDSRPVCRIVFLRPVSAHQLLKSNGCRETSNLRHELTSVVSRLNREMQENSKLREDKIKFESECTDLKAQNRKLKLQVLSLQSVLICLYQLFEKNNFQSDWDSIHSSFFNQCSNIVDIFQKTCNTNKMPFSLNGMTEKTFPWAEMNNLSEACKTAFSNMKQVKTVKSDDKEHG